MMDLDLELPSGRGRARRHGAAGAPAVICVPGLTANLCSFDLIGQRAARRGRPVVAVDLRGRGRSAHTSPGSYGWPAHARDVLAVADRLGAERFAVVGHSMGAYVAMEIAKRAPERLERAVLIDAAGLPDRASATAIVNVTARLGQTYPSIQARVADARALRIIEPWHPLWERYFEYDAVPNADGVGVRTSRAAVLEDVAYAGLHDPRGLWECLRCPVLLLRAARPIGGGHVVTPATAADFTAAVPRTKLVEIDATHHGIVGHNASVASIRAFLSPR